MNRQARLHLGSLSALAVVALTCAILLASAVANPGTVIARQEPVATPPFQVTLTGLQKAATSASRYEVTSLSSSVGNVVNDFYLADNSHVATVPTSGAYTLPPSGNITFDLGQIVAIPIGFAGYVVVSADQPISVVGLSSETYTSTPTTTVTSTPTVTGTPATFPTPHGVSAYEGGNDQNTALFLPAVRTDNGYD